MLTPQSIINFTDKFPTRLFFRLIREARQSIKLRALYIIKFNALRSMGVGGGSIEKRVAALRRCDGGCRVFVDGFCVCETRVTRCLKYEISLREVLLQVRLCELCCYREQDPLMFESC